MIEEGDHEGYKKSMSWAIGSESQKSWANKVLDRKVEMINDLIINSYYKDLITEEEGNYFLIETMNEPSDYEYDMHMDTIQRTNDLIRSDK